MKDCAKYLIFVCCLLLFSEAWASHIVGGEATYAFIGTVDSGGIVYNHYVVSISVYEDCLNGQPSAIEQDNPAYVAAYDSSGAIFNIDSVDYNSGGSRISIPTNFSNLCVSNPPTVCLLKTTFVKTYYFPPSTMGYIIAYQRCCRNAQISNILSPGSTGSTYYCKIPPSGLAVHNNSAIFKNYPPLIICANNPLIYDHSATDADGDSLSYSFFPSLTGANGALVKPIPSAPPYTQVTYVYPWSYGNPITSSPAIQIDPKTGLITGTPTAVGRYLVTVCCKEWRNGKLINTVFREFQFVVTPCTKSVVADIPLYSDLPNTYLVDCNNYSVQFTNTSTGGITYHWDFGSNSADYDTSAAFQPTFTYPDTGTYIVKLVVNPASTCTDSIWRYVKIYPYFIANFADTGAQCPGSSISYIDRSSSTLKPLTNWTWAFGDGTVSTLQNPVHSYSLGGTYNVTLISGNYERCADTDIQQITIQDFTPFAGHDTIVLKGEHVQLQGQGGISYVWSPSAYLNDTVGQSPLGYYTDTGTFKYFLNVVSAYGCRGEDSVKVQVVDNAAFFMPTAFSPNGDGKNDYFRPLAIGYKQLNYFKIFNRWGQMVYSGQSFDIGWDGTYKSQACDMGTYYWEIEYTDRYGITGKCKGDVTLVR